MTDVYVLATLQSLVGLAFGLSVTLAVRLYHFTRGLIRVWAIGSGAVLVYGILFAILADSTNNRRLLQAVAMAIVLWVLAGAHYHFSHCNNKDHQ